MKSLITYFNSLNSYGKKIGLGYGLVVLILVLIVGITIWKINESSQISNQIRTLRAPTTQAILTLLNGINESLAATRSWVILEEEKFKHDRDKAWKNSIHPTSKTLLELSRGWKSQKDLKRLAEINTQLKKLKDIQLEIENIASTTENEPALKILLEQVNPETEDILENINELIQIEKNSKATIERKVLLGNMTDFRGSMLILLANMRSYLLTGNITFRENFEIFWDKNTDFFHDIEEHSELLTSKQSRLLFLIQSRRMSLRPLTMDMLDIRAGDQYNMAKYWLQSRASPVAMEIKSLLGKTLASQKGMMEQDFLREEKQGQILFSFLWILLIIGTGLCALLGVVITRSVTGSISKAQAAEDVARKSLVEEKEKLMKDDWVKSSYVSIFAELQGIKNIPTMAQNLLNGLAPTVDASLAVFYIYSPDENGRGTKGKLSLTGSYAYTKRKNVSDSFDVGEGLVGQCALEKKPIVLTQVPEDYLQVTSGLGGISPNTITVLPIIYEDELLAVLELASFNEFNQFQQELVDQVVANLGVIIDNISGRERTERLLDETKLLVEQTKVQSEELRANNEQMQLQTDKLVESEEELRASSEELRATNDELEEKSEHLKKQNEDIQKQSAEIQASREMVEEKAKDLELASKYKSEFLANMSHELRTPLNSLLILSKTLADNDEGNLTPTQIEEMKVIYGGGQQLLELINDILDLSKVEAGRLDLRIEKAKIESLFRDQQILFSPVAKKSGVDFILEYDDDLPYVVETDVQRVNQVLKNLLSNAFKFTRQGTVTLRAHHPDSSVKFSSNLTRMDCIAFSVKDTGIGIAEDKLKAIFQAFQQEDGSTSRKYGGTGLGLAISMQLSKLLGGEIHVTSEKGKGSTFTIYHPIKSAIKVTVDEEPELQILETPVDEPEITVLEDLEDNAEELKFIPDDRDNLKGHRSILIIEDDKNYAKILLKHIRGKGYKCISAGSGASGFKLAQIFQPNGIILDMQLPDANGRGVLQNLKGNAKTKDIPVHILSSFEPDPEILDLGAEGFQTKPDSLEKLDGIFSNFEKIFGKNLTNVLLVENDPKEMKEMSKLIKDKKLNLITATCGKEAVDKIKEGGVECVILDHNLPDLSGLEVLKQLDEDPQAETPKVIVYTAKQLTREENLKLSEYTGCIVVKGPRSSERLLDELHLFLNSITPPASPEIVDKKVPTKINNKVNKALEGRKVLLVDDDMRNNYAVAKVLQKAGMEITMAENGKMGIEKLEKEKGKIEIVLMDIMMPIMDGYEAIKSIRKKKNFKKLPIIAMTAKAMAEDRKKCLDVGASDYLTKPIDIDKLLSLIKVWLNKS